MCRSKIAFARVDDAAEGGERVMCQGRSRLLGVLTTGLAGSAAGRGSRQ